MSRRRKAVKRIVMPDPKYNDKIISKFIGPLNVKDSEDILQLVNEK